MRALAYCGAVRKIRPTFARGSVMWWKSGRPCRTRRSDWATPVN